MAEASNQDKVRVVLADDHTVVREGLRALLQGAPDVEVVGEAQTGREAVDLTTRLRPSVVVLDISMPQLSGVDAAREILRHAPGTKIIMLSAYSDEEYVSELVQAGVTGYLVKDTAATDLVIAIRESNRGNAFFSPSISKKLSEYCRTRAGQHTLTAREREVLRLIAEGRLNKQIAGDLSISIKTVEKHRQNLMNKLNIHETAGLTRYAISRGLVQR